MGIRVLMNKYFWILFLPLHAFFITALYYFEYISPLLTVIFWIVLSGFGVGVTLHRLLAHRAFNTHPVIENVLSLVSCICVQGSPMFWVNIHRGYHHKYTDTDKDPHSPKKGKLWAYMLWPNKIHYKDLSYRYITDLMRSDWQQWLNNRYFLINYTAWMIAAAIGPTMFLSLVVAQVITMHLEFCVNLFCHLRTMPFSYRNFETEDDSVNYWIPGLLFWGIGFHNNHHANPTNYDFGHTKREIDLTKYLVRLVKS